MKTFHILHKLLIVFFAASISFLYSCKDEESFVLRNTDLLEFTYESSSQPFTICTNGSWSVSSEQSWIQISPSSGLGDGTTRENVSVLVDRNTAKKRFGQVIIHAAGKEVLIDITQEDGRIQFGVPSLSGTIPVGEDIEDVNIRIPYERAAGNENFTVSVAVSGDAAAGINAITQYPVQLTEEKGMVLIPFTGKPLVTGSFTLSFTTSLADADIENMIGTVGSAKLYHGADFIISGYLSDPDGTDSPLIGAVAGGGFVHTGGYEYVQLLALKDIDFTVTPYCLVTCTNANRTSPGEMGWIAGKEGNKLTYQFNIDMGSVKKGEFFYVGGNSRLLDSYPASGTEASPMVSAQKWPIAIDYYSVPGADGNGIAVAGSGILGNTVNGTPPTNVGADGIAVFRGTSIDENTVPMDAVFYGDGLDKFVFQVPNNDWYRRIAEDGSNQPYFGLGSNVKTAPTVPVHDDGYFTALGGEVSETEWITPRSGSFILMKKSAGIINTSDQIELPESCTKFIVK